MKGSHKRELVLLILLLVVFSVVFTIAYIHLGKGQSVFGLDIPYQIEDYIILTLSLLSILRIFFLIIKH